MSPREPSLYELIVGLQTPGPERERSARTLTEVLRKLGYRGELAQLHEEAVQDILVKLLLGARPSSTDDRAVRAWFATIIKRHQLAAVRKRTRKVEGVTMQREAGPEALAGLVDPQTVELAAALRDGPEPELDELERASRELLARLFAEALRGCDPAYRSHLQTSWRQLVSLHLDGTSVAEILREDEGVVPGDLGWKKAVDRLHTSHRRARTRLDATIEALVDSGELSREEASLARACIRRLRRRQQRPARVLSR